AASSIGHLPQGKDGARCCAVCRLPDIRSRSDNFCSGFSHHTFASDSWRFITGSRALVGGPDKRGRERGASVAGSAGSPCQSNSCTVAPAVVIDDEIGGSVAVFCTCIVSGSGTGESETSRLL